MVGSVARGNYAVDPLLEPIAAALGDIFFNVKVFRSMVLLILVALVHVIIVLVFLITVLFCGGHCQS